MRGTTACCAVAAVALSAAIASTSASAARSAGTGPAAATCTMRAEPASGSSARPPADKLIGGAAWIGVPGQNAVSQDFTAGPDRDASQKIPVFVKSGHRLTLRVELEDRDHAGLQYTRRSRTARRSDRADRSVTFTPCPPQTRRLTGDGHVGSYTFWAGTVMVDGPRCVGLEVWVDGRWRTDVFLPLGRSCASK